MLFKKSNKFPKSTPNRERREEPRLTAVNARTCFGGAGAIYTSHVSWLKFSLASPRKAFGQERARFPNSGVGIGNVERTPHIVTVLWYLEVDLYVGIST